MRNSLGDPPPDYDNARGYADAWGYRLGSGAANLIDWVRDEYRAKYGTDYRLRRIGKNKYMAVPAEPAEYSSGTYGIPYVCEHAGKFGTTVVKPKGDVYGSGLVYHQEAQAQSGHRSG